MRRINFLKPIVRLSIAAGLSLLGGLFLSPFPALSSVQTDGSNPGEARTQLKQAIKRLEQGDSAAALPVLEKIALEFRASGDLHHEAETLRAIGDAYANQGEIFVPLAAERYQQAVDLFRQAAVTDSSKGLNVTAEMAFNAQTTLAKLGDLYLRMGQVEEAERFYSQIAPDKPKIDVFEAQYNAGQRVSTVTGKSTSTKSRSEGTARRLGGLLSRKPSLDTVGSVSSEVESARATVVDTAQAVTGVVEDLHQANLLLKGFILSDISLGRTARLRNDESTARERFESALSLATRYPPVFGKSAAAKRFQIVALTDLGDLAFQQKRYVDAAHHYEDARKRAIAAQRPDLSWPAARGVGRTQWVIAQAMGPKGNPATFNGSRDAALSAYREALNIIEDLRGRSIRGDEARQSFSAQIADVYREFTEILATLAVQPDGDFSKPLQGIALQAASEAFTNVERTRSRSLLDLLAERGAEISEGLDPALVQKRQEVYARQSELSDQLMGLSQGQRAVGSQADEGVEAEIDRLSTESARIEAELRSANPRYAALTASTPWSLTQVQSSLLDADTTLLNYALGESRSYLWVVRKDGVWIYPLEGRPMISDKVAHFRELLLASSQTRGTSGENPPAVSTPDLPETKPRAVGSGAEAGVRTAATKAGPGAAAPRQDTRDLKSVTVPRTSVRPLKEDPAAREYALVAHELYSSILAPAAAVIQGKRLLVVCDDVLNTVPFEALVTELPADASQTPADYATLAYLVSRLEISYIPSVTMVAAVREQQTGKPTGQGALLVGDPIFEPTDSRLQSVPSSPEEEPSARDLIVKTFVSVTEVSTDANTPAASASPLDPVPVPRLPATRTEVVRIAQIVKQAGAPADVLLDLQASEGELLKRDLKPYRILHLATHGLLNAERPQFSGLLLSLVGNSDGQDGFLRTQEVFNLRLGSPLVMLSACKTGLGRQRKGEGLIGLTRAFHYAGATAVGVSLWPVDDDSTAALMTSFYSRLLLPKAAAGKPAGSEQSLSGAMRQAQLGLIEERRYSAPFFWAPFVLVGDYRWAS